MADRQMQSLPPMVEGSPQHTQKKQTVIKDIFRRAMGILAKPSDKWHNDPSVFFNRRSEWGFKDTETALLAGLFGQALYDIIYPRWWGGQGKLSEVKITDKVSNMPFLKGSNTAGLQACSPYDFTSTGDYSSPSNKVKGAAPKVDPSKMAPAGMSSDFVPRTGGPKKRKDPYGLDPTGKMDHSKLVNLNIFNEGFIKPKLRAVEDGHASQPVNYPIYKRGARIASKIKPFVDKDKHHTREVQRERDGYSEDEERENAVEIIGGMSPNRNIDGEDEEREVGGGWNGRRGWDGSQKGPANEMRASGSVDGFGNGRRSASAPKGTIGASQGPNAGNMQREDSLDKLRTPMNSKPKGKTSFANQNPYLGGGNTLSSAGGADIRPDQASADLNASYALRTPNPPNFTSSQPYIQGQKPLEGEGFNSTAKQGNKTISPIPRQGFNPKGKAPGEFSLSVDGGDVSHDLTVGRRDQNRTGHINIEGESYSGPNPVGKAILQAAEPSNSQDRDYGTFRPQKSSATAAFGGDSYQKSKTPVARNDYKPMDWNRTNSFHDDQTQVQTGMDSPSRYQPNFGSVAGGAGRGPYGSTDSLGGGQEPYGTGAQPRDQNYSSGSNLDGNQDGQYRFNNRPAVSPVYKPGYTPAGSDVYQSQEPRQGSVGKQQSGAKSYSQRPPSRSGVKYESAGDTYQPGQYSSSNVRQPSGNVGSASPYQAGQYSNLGDRRDLRDPVDFDSVPNYGSYRNPSQANSGRFMPAAQQNPMNSEEKLFQYSATNDRQGEGPDSNVRSTFNNRDGSSDNIHEFMRAERQRTEAPPVKQRTEIFYSKEKPVLESDKVGAYEVANKLLSSKIIGHLTHHQSKVEQIPEPEQRQEGRQAASTRPVYTAPQQPAYETGQYVK